MMSDSVARSCSASSATTCSFSILCMSVPPAVPSRKRLSPPREVGSGTGIDRDVLPIYLGRTSAPRGCRLSSAVSVASRLDGSSHLVGRDRVGGVGDVADPPTDEMEDTAHTSHKQ